MDSAVSLRRLSLKLDTAGNVLSASDAPGSLFGFPPSRLVGRNVREFLDCFAGLPVRGGPQGLDVEHVLEAMVHR
jgi:hypothetical protein